MADKSENQPVVVGNVSKSGRKLKLPFTAKKLGLVIVIIVVAALIIHRIAQGTRLKTITYNNGQGHSFRIKYYHSYYLSKDFTTTGSKQALHSGDIMYKGSLTGLASKVSVNNYFPLWVGINVSPLPQNTQLQDAKTTIGTSCAPSPTLFTVYNSATKQKVAICKFELNANRPGYTATFIYKKNLYYVTITQVAADADLSNRAQVGLSAYKSDLNTIIGSIQPE